MRLSVGRHPAQGVAVSNETLFGLRGRPWRSLVFSFRRSSELVLHPGPGEITRVRPVSRVSSPRHRCPLLRRASPASSIAAERMRLLVGAQLKEQDVEAIRRGIELQDTLAQRLRGILTDPEALADHLVRRRLETLAWLVANDLLEIRVCVEADPQTGAPIASRGCVPAKSGILRDEYGDAIAYVGSINETPTAWQTNYEKFSVFTSREDGKFFKPEVENFERLWANAEAGWRTAGLPTALRDELLILKPSQQPHATDPLESSVALRAGYHCYVNNVSLRIHVRNLRLSVPHG